MHHPLSNLRRSYFVTFNSPDGWSWTQSFLFQGDTKDAIRDSEYAEPGFWRVKRWKR